MGPKFNQYVSSLLVPTGVTAIRDFGTAGTLNLSGNLTNAGSLLAVSSSSQVLTAVISAANITNQMGAVLTSVLPASGVPGFHTANLIGNSDLNLNAQQNIVNAGKISRSYSQKLWTD